MPSSSCGRSLRSKSMAAARRSVFGTLPGPHVGDPPGPDRTGPHGLLPPIQRETLAFDRPYEAGPAVEFQRIAAAARDVVELAAGQHARAPGTSRRRRRWRLRRQRSVRGSVSVPRRPRRRAALRVRTRERQPRVRDRRHRPGPHGPIRSRIDRDLRPVVRVSSRIEACRLEAGMAGPSSAGCRPRIAGGAATFCSGGAMTSPRSRRSWAAR